MQNNLDTLHQDLTIYYRKVSDLKDFHDKMAKYFNEEEKVV